MSPAELLADAVLQCKPLLTRYLAGFSDQTRTRQAPTLPNHAAWCLGHCALTMHRVAGYLDGGPVPEDDIAPPGAAASVEAPADRFRADDVAFGSTPRDEPGRYPPLARCVAIYERACDRLAQAVRHASPADLARDVPWGPQGQRVPLATLVGRVVFHNGVHTGQIADLRRALGFEPVMRPTPR